MRIEKIFQNKKQAKEVYQYIKRDFPRNERIPYLFFKLSFLKVRLMEAVYLMNNAENCGYIAYMPLEEGALLTSFILPSIPTSVHPGTEADF